jgi:hypothetical protein
MHGNARRYRECVAPVIDCEGPERLSPYSLHAMSIAHNPAGLATTRAGKALEFDFQSEARSDTFHRHRP